MHTICILYVSCVLTSLFIFRYRVIIRNKVNVPQQIRGSFYKPLRNIAAIWALVVPCTASPLVGWSHFHLDEQMMVCGLDWTNHTLSSKSYPVFYLLCLVILPLVVMAATYAKLYTKVSIVAKKIRLSRSSVIHLAMRVSKASKISVISTQSNTPSTSSAISNMNNALHHMMKGSDYNNREKRDIRHERRLAKIMTITVVLYTLSWCSYGFITLILPFCHSHIITATNTTDTANTSDGCNVLSAELLQYAYVLLMCSVLYNPILYLRMNKRFRRTVSHFVGDQRHSRRTRLSVLPLRSNSQATHIAKATDNRIFAAQQDISEECGRRSSELPAITSIKRPTLQKRISHPITALTTINEDDNRNSGFMDSSYNVRDSASEQPDKVKTGPVAQPLEDPGVRTIHYQVTGHGIFGNLSRTESFLALPVVET